MKTEEVNTMALYHTITSTFDRDETISMLIGMLESHFKDDYKLIIDNLQQFRDHFDAVIAEEMEGE